MKELIKTDIKSKYGLFDPKEYYDKYLNQPICKSPMYSSCKECPWNKNEYCYYDEPDMYNRTLDYWDNMNDNEKKDTIEKLLYSHQYEVDAYNALLSKYSSLKRLISLSYDHDELEGRYYQFLRDYNKHAFAMSNKYSK